MNREEDIKIITELQMEFIDKCYDDVLEYDEKISKLSKLSIGRKVYLLKFMDSLFANVVGTDVCKNFLYKYREELLEMRQDIKNRVSYTLMSHVE